MSDAVAWVSPEGEAIIREEVAKLHARVAELESRLAAFLTICSDKPDPNVAERLSHLESMVAMMRHAIDVAVLRVEPYPDDSKPAQFSPPRSQQEFDKLVADIDDSPFSPAEQANQLAKLR